MRNDISSKRTMQEVLNASDRLRTEVRGISGVLAYLWRTILLERNVTLQRFDKLCARFMTKARRNLGSSKIANYFNRSNIFREMSRPTMTFKVFVKGMQLLGVEHMKVTVEITTAGSTSIHSTSLVLSGEDGVSFEDLLDADDESQGNTVDELHQDVVQQTGPVNLPQTQPSAIEAGALPPGTIGQDEAE